MNPLVTVASSIPTGGAVASWPKDLGYVCPFMSELVDSLYTEELNALIDKTCQTGLDKRTFMMFIMMYFFTFINVTNGTADARPEGGQPTENRKAMLKVFMSELIMNSEKRRRCVELYMMFEKSVEKSVATLDLPALTS